MSFTSHLRGGGCLLIYALSQLGYSQDSPCGWGCSLRSTGGAWNYRRGPGARNTKHPAMILTRVKPSIKIHFCRVRVEVETKGNIRKENRGGQQCSGRSHPWQAEDTPPPPPSISTQKDPEKGSPSKTHVIC